MSDSPSAAPKRVGIAADHDLSRRSIWLEYCVRLTMKWWTMATASGPKAQQSPDSHHPASAGGRVVANMFAWELVRTFLQARFSGAERHRRRLAKVARLESRESE